MRLDGRIVRQGSSMSMHDLPVGWCDQEEPTCAHPFLSLLQLREELEVPRYLGNRHCQYAGWATVLFVGCLSQSSGAAGSRKGTRFAGSGSPLHETQMAGFHNPIHPAHPSKGGEGVLPGNISLVIKDSPQTEPRNGSSRCLSVH
jgi:hypothetical protein